MRAICLLSLSAALGLMGLLVASSAALSAPQPVTAAAAAKPPVRGAVSVVEALKAGDAAFKAGQFAEAKRDYEAALQALPVMPPSRQRLVALSRLSMVYISVKDYAAAALFLRQAIELTTQLEGTQSLLAIEHRDYLAQALIHLHQPAAAAQEYAAVLDDYRTRYGAQHAKTLDVQQWLASQQLDAGDYKNAERNFRELIAARGAGTQDRYLARAYTGLGETLQMQEQSAAAVRELTQALTIWQKLPASESSGQGRTLSVRGRAYLKSGEYTNAETDLRQALQLLSADPEQQMLAVDTRCTLGATLFEQNKVDAALAETQAAVKVLEQHPGDDAQFRCLQLLSEIYIERNQRAPLIATLRQLATLPTRNAVEFDAQVEAVERLAVLLKEQGRFQEERPVLQAMLAKHRAAFPQPNLDTAYMQYQLGEAELQAKQYAAARKLFASAVPGLRKFLPADSVRLAQALTDSSVVQRYFKDDTTAEAQVREALEIYAKHPEENSAEVFRAHIIYAGLLRTRGGRPVQALQHYEQGWKLGKPWACTAMYSYAGFRLADTYFQQRQLPRAETVLRETRGAAASCRLPNEVDAWTAVLLARTLQVRGDRVQAQAVANLARPGCAKTAETELQHACKVLLTELANKTCTPCLPAALAAPGVALKPF